MPFVNKCQIYLDAHTVKIKRLLKEPLEVFHWDQNNEGGQKRSLITHGIYRQMMAETTEQENFSRKTAE